MENSHSLKDKRHVVKSLKDRLRNKFNVAVAEIDYQDLWQRAAVAAVTVASDHGHAEQVLQSVEAEAQCRLLGRDLVDVHGDGWIEHDPMDEHSRIRAFPKPSGKSSPRSSASR